MYSCLLVGGAPTEHKGLDFVLENCSFDTIIAVDAGYAALVERGIAPHHVFGDFDSLGFIPQEVEGGACVHPFDPHKDFTDMDLALNFAIGEGFTHIIMCDGLHARLDHSLANLQLMAAAARKGQRVWGITEEEVVVALDAKGELDHLEIAAGSQGICSVLAHSDSVSGAYETGLAYGLEDAQLTNCFPLGISNELTGAPARISLDAGSAWIFLPLHELKSISYAGESFIK
ncbi:MAG: thiamine diphosphokinase [Eggerthella sp.]|nr:thiamine diphosphokinase [Eggerthella sp.]